MVEFGTSDKLLLLSQIELENNSGDETELFEQTAHVPNDEPIIDEPAQHRRALSRARTSTKSNLFDDTVEETMQQNPLAMKSNETVDRPSGNVDNFGHKCVDGYKFMILNLTFLFNVSVVA